MEEKIFQKELRLFVEMLATKELSNPSDVTNMYDYKCESNAIRRKNLELYLNKMKSAKVLLVGEAPGYKGCRLTGIPFTSEYRLKNEPLFESNQFLIENEKNPEKENSATVVWPELQKYSEKPLMWNIFPFHPHDKDNIKSNRKPSNKELIIGTEILIELLSIFEIKKILAIGRLAEKQIKAKIELPCEYIRHPSYGGKNEFIAGLNKHNSNI